METKARDAFINLRNSTPITSLCKTPVSSTVSNRRNADRHQLLYRIQYFVGFRSGNPRLWGFAPIPGTVIVMTKPINRLSTTPRLRFRGGYVESHQASERIVGIPKWWTSKDTQIRYGRELEAIIGAAARYPTANVEALANLPWPTSDYKVLRAQMEKSNGVPVVVGSYIIGRYIDNAFRAVINDKANPNDSLYINVLKINKELARKRKSSD